MRIALSLLLLAGPVVHAAEEPAIYNLPAPRITCDAASGVLDVSGHIIEGSVRKRCDVLWSRSLNDGGVGPWKYGDFISQCSQSCAAPKPVSQASSVTQLYTLGTAAAQSAAGGSGISTALLVGGGIAGAIGIGVLASNKDKPASP